MLELDDFLLNYDSSRPKTRAPVSDLLTAEEELALLAQAQAGSLAATDELVKRNVGLIRAWAKKFTTPALEFDDAFSEASIGFLLAIQKFVPARKCRLSTLASHWMKQRLLRASPNNNRNIRLPVHVAGDVKRLERIGDRLRIELDRDPTDDELLVALRQGVVKDNGRRWTPQYLERMRNVPLETLSLDYRIGEDSEDDFAAYAVADKNFPGSSEHLTRLALDQVIDQMWGLPERSGDILRRRLGLAPYECPQSLQEVGDALKMSREGVRQGQVKAVTRLRRLLNDDDTLAALVRALENKLNAND